MKKRILFVVLFLFVTQLFELGGSSGGARPKIFIAYNPDNEEIIHGEKSAS